MYGCPVIYGLGGKKNEFCQYDQKKKNQNQNQKTKNDDVIYKERGQLIPCEWILK